MIKFKGIKLVNEPEAVAVEPRPEQPEKQVLRTAPLAAEEAAPIVDAVDGVGPRPLFDPSEPEDTRTPEERIKAVEDAAAEAAMLETM